MRMIHLRTVGRASVKVGCHKEWISRCADPYVQPLNMGWHFGKRVDFNAGYAFFAPTGRYTAGANNNVGSGYWGNDITSSTTLYITKNQGTTANLATDWEIHGQKTVASTPAGQLQQDNSRAGVHR